MPLWSDSGFTVISASNTAPDLTLEGNENQHPGYLRTAHSDKVQGAAAAQFVYEVLGLRKAASIHDGSIYADSLQQVFVDKFKELGEAYRILSNPQKRRQYDVFGSVGGDYVPPSSREGGQGGSSRPGAFGGEEALEGFDFDEIFEDLLGRMSGRGRRTGPGSRNIRVDYERGSDIEVELLVTVEDLLRSASRQIRIGVTRRCEKCEGEGSLAGAVCAACGGTGRLTRRKAYRIRIPSGLGDGN